MPTFRLVADEDLPVIVVLVLVVSIERLKNDELDEFKLLLALNEFKLLVFVNILEEYESVELLNRLLFNKLEPYQKKNICVFEFSLKQDRFIELKNLLVIESNFLELTVLFK